MKKKQKVKTSVEEPVIHKKKGHASEGDSSRTQKGNPAQKAKGKGEGRK